jgi:hypothetical protein
MVTNGQRVHDQDLLYSETERALAATLAGLLASRAAPADVLARTEQPLTCDTGLWTTVAAAC